MGSYSEKLSRFVAGLAYEDLPKEVLESARLRFLDVLGISLASSAMPFGKQAIALGQGLGRGEEASIIGAPGRLPAPQAALVNGTLAHGLDFDDTHAEAVIHASACVVPAALAAGEAVGTDGKALLTAAVAGWEVLIRLGLVCPGRFHDRGFHATGVCGPFATSLIAGKLWGSSPEEMAHALGLCGSMAAGSLEFLTDGSWTKRIHPGWAGHSGLIAARMARLGFTGPREVLEGRFGLYASHVGRDGLSLPRLTEGLGERWRTLELDFKPYPCCHYNHAFIDAALFLREEHRIRAEAIEGVECMIHPRQIPIVAEPRPTKVRPQTPYDAQFSLPYAVAVALLEGRVDIDTFQPPTIEDPRILDLASRTHCLPHPESDFPRHFPGTIRIRLRDGHLLERREPLNRGCSENPLSPEEVRRKFRRNAERTLLTDRVSWLLEMTEGLDSLKEVSPLLSLCRPVS